MKIGKIIEKLNSGSVIKKSSVMKFKYGKISRGSFYEYYIDDVKIRSRQFEAVYNLLKTHNRGFNETTYILH